MWLAIALLFLSNDIVGSMSSRIAKSIPDAPLIDFNSLSSGTLRYRPTSTMFQGSRDFENYQIMANNILSDFKFLVGLYKPKWEQLDPHPEATGILGVHMLRKRLIANY